MKNIFFTLLFAMWALPFVGQAYQDTSNMPHMQILTSSGELIDAIYPFDASYRGGGSFAVGDLGTDKVDEIVIGSGPGSQPIVFLYRQDGSVIHSFLAYSDQFDGGVSVAVGDVDGNGINDIVTGAMYGGGPHIRIFDGYGNLLSQFFAYQEDFLGGVSVSVGDVNGDGVAEIITGAGVTGGPHIKLFTMYGEHVAELFAGGAFEGAGVSVAAGDVNGDGDAELIAGCPSGSAFPVQLFDWDSENHQMAFVLDIDAAEQIPHGVHVFSGDVDSDGMDEIGIGSRSVDGNIVFYEMNGQKRWEVSPFEKMKSATASVVINSDPRVIVFGGESQVIQVQGQYVFIDLDRQTLFAYQDGVLVRSFLISGGTPYYPSPVGEYAVLDKILWKDYTWNFGDDDARNYDLSDVKYNVKFKDMYYIHSAYWHDSFGVPMSHGCINASYEDAEWIYNWIDVGAVVEVE